MQLVLDLDGTLINSTERHWLLLESILIDKGLNYGFDQNDFLKMKINGCSTKKYCQEILHLPLEIANEINSIWIKHIEDTQWLRLDVLYDDAIDFLNWCQKCLYDVWFLTARSNKNGLIRELERLDIMKYAKSIYIVDPRNASEEKTVKLQEIKRKGEVVFIGDMESDYKAGGTAGVKTLILNRGFRSKQYLADAGIESFLSLDDIKINQL